VFFFPLFVQQNLAQALQKKIVCCFSKPSYGNERNPQLTNPKPQKSKESRKEGRRRPLNHNPTLFVCFITKSLIEVHE
jgi:hypothetical protein